MSDASSSHPVHTPPHAGRSWGPVASVLVTMLAFFGAQALAAVILVAVIGTGEQGQEWLASTAGQFYFVLLSDAFTLLTVWMFLRGRGINLKQLGFTVRPSWRDIGYAILAYLAYYAVLIAAIIAVGTVVPIDLDQKQELGFEQLGASADKLMALIGLVLLAPIVEEIIFRGFVFTGMRKQLTFIWATFFTSLLFAAPHLLQSSEGLLWIAGVDTFILSFALCYLREKTGALWAPMLLHAIKNSIAFILMLASATTL